MSLQDIALKTEYRSFQDDIAQDFYIPALKQAVRYKRAVGFFSSSILSMITAGQQACMNFISTKAKSNCWHRLNF